MLDGAFSFDTSIYYIDWKDVQLQLYTPELASAYLDNAGRARSSGIELAFEWAPLEGLTISSWAAWAQPEVTETPPELSTVVISRGDRLPYSSRFSGSLSVDQELAFTSSVSGRIGATVSYIGERPGIFHRTFIDSSRQQFPSYAQTDLRATVEYDTWSINLFVNNVTDKRAFISGGSGTQFPYAFMYLQPRTAGVSLAKTF